MEVELEVRTRWCWRLLLLTLAWDGDKAWLDEGRRRLRFRDGIKDLWEGGGGEGECGGESEEETFTKEEKEQPCSLVRGEEEGEDEREGHLEAFEGGDRRKCFPQKKEAEGEEAEEEEEEERFCGLSAVSEQWGADREADGCFPELWHKAGILEARKATTQWLLSPAALLLLLSACKHTPWNIRPVNTQPTWQENRTHTGYLHALASQCLNHCCIWYNFLINHPTPHKTHTEE